MEKWKKRSVDLLTSLYLGSKEKTTSVIPYYPQKISVSGKEERYFTRHSPERCGVSSKRIYHMLADLEYERRANIHNLMVLKGGEVIAECSRAGYDVNVWHLSHSMSKTVTGMVIGLLFDDGIIDLGMKLTDIFPEIEYKDKRFADITIEHLLTMRSGVDFSEAGAVTESGWTSAFFKGSLYFAPGTSFNYNSMNSYILARAAERITGRSFISIVEQRLFEPLFIKNYLWELGPEGTAKGGWGLYLSCESWAKLGQMVLSRGVFEGARILSEDWIERAVSMSSPPSETNSTFGYGYQIWVSEYGEILFNGMLGQNVWICPDNKIIAVIQSGNNELFQDSPALMIIRKYMRAEIKDELHRYDIRPLHEKERCFFDSRMWVKPMLVKSRRFFQLLHLREKQEFDKRWQDVLGTYVFVHNNIGMLPLFVRGMQNNLHSSVEKLTLSREDESLYLSFTESGTEYRIEVGLYGYADSELDFRGERYMVKCMGEAKHNPGGISEFRIELLFPELPNTRMLRITIPGENKIRLEFLEVPNSRVIDELVNRMPSQSPLIGFAFGLLERGFGEDFISKRTEEAFAPVLIGADADFEGYESILEGENLSAEKRARIGRLLHLFVDRFFGDDEDDDFPDDNKKKSRKLFVSEVFSIIRSNEKNNKK